MSSDRIYQMPDGELIFPGNESHELLDITHDMSQSQQRKVLELLRQSAAGEFDIEQTKTWTPDQMREFMESLPEAAP